MINHEEATTTFTHQGKEVTMPFQAFCHYLDELHYGCPEEAALIVQENRL